MASPKRINLKVFAAGEIPYPVAHTFLDSSGSAIDLTGWTAWVEIEGPDGVTAGAGAVGTAQATNGIISYTWDEDDMQEPGKYRMLIWVADGINRFASDLIQYEVYDGPGPTPPA